MRRLLAGQSWCSSASRCRGWHRRKPIPRLCASARTSNDVQQLDLQSHSYTASYAFIVTSLGLVARTSWLADDLPRAVRFDRRSLVFVAGAYVLVLALIVGLQLS